VGRTRRLTIGASCLLALVAAACMPYFPDGATLSTTALGPLVTLTWTGALEEDDGQEVAYYAIEVDGVVVDTIDDPATSCVLTGLAASTSYDLGVTAYDDVGAWSGRIEDSPLGKLETTYATPATGGAGATMDCVSTTDTDGDRLPNAVENNSGTYVSAAQTGSNPSSADSDGDGLRDGDEVLGTTAGLNLPAMGTRPTKKNILFEFDWFNDNLDPGICGAHSHQPSATAVGSVATAFANSPVTNPDGTTGITMIGDYGQGGLFAGGNLIADPDGVIAGGVNNVDFQTHKAANFAANREGYFHYTLLPHRYGTNSTSSGQAELPGDDLIVSLYCYGSNGNVANTILHEVGHNLLLRHGGNVDTPNYKPNYNSVMNYKYQFPGVDSNCTPAGDGVLDYSRGTRISLNENALVEANGTCGAGFPVDWNGNSVIDGAAYARDINVDGNLIGDGAFSTLTDFNDWANIQLGWVVDGDGAPVEEPEIISEQPVPVEAQIPMTD
jgi:hypothetical protein